MREKHCGLSILVLDHLLLPCQTSDASGNAGLKIIVHRAGNFFSLLESFLPP